MAFARGIAEKSARLRVTSLRRRAKFTCQLTDWIRLQPGSALENGGRGQVSMRFCRNRSLTLFNGSHDNRAGDGQPPPAEQHKPAEQQSVRCARSDAILGARPEGSVSNDSSPKTIIPPSPQPRSSTIRDTDAEGQTRPNAPPKHHKTKLATKQALPPPAPAKAGSTELARRGTESMQLKTDQDLASQAMAAAHPDLLTDAAYVGLSAKMFPAQELLLKSATDATLAFQRQMHPKDALERLALAQVLMTHARAAWLTKLATTQTDVPSVVAINEACERASGTFVRLMRGIGEYRQPPSPSTTVSIGQANVAQQQIVQNIREVPGEKNVDERTRIRGNRTAAKAKAISAVREGIEVSARRRLANPAVDKEHRSAKPGRQGSHPHERAETRRAIRHRCDDEKAGEGDS